MNRTHDVRRWLRRQAPWLPRRLLVLFVMLTVLVPALAGGTPYVWCVGLKRAQMSCCCHGRAAAADADHDHTPRDVDAIANTCCVGLRVASIPPSDVPVHAVPVIAPPTSLFAWLTLAALYPTIEAPDALAQRHYEREARAGPEPPLYALDCVYLN